MKPSSILPARPGAGSALSVALALSLAAGAAAQAQEDPRAKELEALRTTVQQLEQALQDVRARLAEMERQARQTAAATNAPVVTTTAPTIAGTKAAPTNAEGTTNYMTLAGYPIPLSPLPPELSGLQRSPIPDFDTFNDHQMAAPRPNNEPIDPALIGFIPIPGTRSLIRFGGSARLDAIYDFGDNGNPNQFIPSGIPVEGQPGADGGSRSTLHAKGTRISFEIRRPARDDGTLRIYNENDFFDDSASGTMKFRVRHFYGQAWNVLIGQTYSAFMDIDAWPDVLDYAGPNALINRRQPQVRFSPPIYDGDAGKMHLIFSVEQPESDLSLDASGVPADAKTVSRAPDGVAAWRWEGRVGHVQLSGLFRSVGYEADAASDETVFGWGLNAAGAFNLFKSDKFSWQVAYGEGMARYVNDIGSADLDAAPDAAGRLTALPVFAATVGYTHQWAAQFRSTVSVGYLHVDPAASLGGSAISDTRYASLNLVWHPTKSFRMGLEYLYGRKETEDGDDGDAHRLDFVLRYDLIR